MGFDDISEGEGYAKFDQGANVLGRISNIDYDEDSYQGNDYKQLEMEFNAVHETEREKGTVPAWISSKITLRDSDEHTSNLAKLLDAAGVLRSAVQQLVEDLGADDEYVDKVVSGEKRFEAKTEEENIALAKAVANHIDGVVLKMGTEWNKGEDYSVVKNFYESVDVDRFEDALEQAETVDSSGADDGDHDTGESDEEGDDLLS